MSNNCEYVSKNDIDETGDLREFGEKEEVCLKDGYYTRGNYVIPHPQPSTGKVYTQIVRSNGKDRWVSASNVGKLVNRKKGLLKFYFNPNGTKSRNFNRNGNRIYPDNNNNNNSVLSGGKSRKSRKKSKSRKNRHLRKTKRSRK